MAHAVKIHFPKNGSAYGIEPRDLRPIHYDDQEIMLTPNITGNLYGVEHSMIGTAMQLVKPLHGEEGVGFLNIGDVRLGVNDKTLKAVEKVSGRANVIVMETTHPPGQTRETATVTEPMVQDSIQEILRKHPKELTVIAMPKNHMERLAGVAEVARANGKKLAIGADFAYMVNQQMFARTNSPVTAEAFYFDLPVVGQDASIYSRPMTQVPTYENSMREIAAQSDMGLLTPQSLSKNPGDWMLVVTPWNKLKYILGNAYLPNGFNYIWSSYFPYDKQDKHQVAANYQFVNEVGGNFYSDFTIVGKGNGSLIRMRSPHENLRFHATGHATADQMINQVLIPAIGNLNRPVKIILTHGVAPYVYSKEIEKAINATVSQRDILKAKAEATKDLRTFGEQLRSTIGKGKIEIVGRLTHYSHEGVVDGSGYNMYSTRVW